MSLVIDEALEVIDGLDLTDEEKEQVATKLLSRLGLAYRVWGADDIQRRLNILDAEPHDEAAIIKHVMEGDDWSTMSEETSTDDANLWYLIEGTRGDHPEWFADN